MKRFIILLIISVITFSTTLFAYDSREQHQRYRTEQDHWENSWGDINIVLEDGRLTFSYEDDEYETVEITEAGKLFVNGEEIELSEHETKLVTDYYHLMLDFQQKAWELGLESGRIGSASTVLAAHALADAFQQEENDHQNAVQAKIDRKAKELQVQKEVLKKQGKELEKLADSVKEMHFALQDRIEALRDLDWFELRE